MQAMLLEKGKAWMSLNLKPMYLPKSSPHPSQSKSNMISKQQTYLNSLFSLNE